MNSVSWFLYAADLLENVRGLVTAIIVITIIAMVVIGIPACIGKFDKYMDGDGTLFDKYWVPALRWSIPLIILCSIVGTAVPSKGTMYAIAASQIGEPIVASTEAREMIDDTKQILREYLKSLKSAK